MRRWRPEWSDIIAECRAAPATALARRGRFPTGRSRRRPPPAAPGVERVSPALRDSCGGRHVRVRGHAKVACHLMFGIPALTVHRLLRLTI